MNLNKLKYYALIFVMFATIGAQITLMCHKETKKQALFEWYNPNSWHHMTIERLHKNLHYVKYIDRSNNLGETALMVAVTSEADPKVIKELLRLGAKINLQSYIFGHTALAYAIEKNASAQIVSVLIDSGSTLETPAGNNSLLMNACYHDNAQTVDLLLEQQIDVNEQNDDGYTALMYSAIYAKSAKIPQKLLDADADINLSTHNGYTALSLALKKNPNPDVRSFFIYNTPNLDYKDNDEWSAIDYALLTYPHNKVAKALVDRGIDLAKHSHLLFKANMQAIKIMLQNGANINARDLEGNTLLINFCEPSTDIKNIHFLLENGAEINAVNNQGQNAILLAVMRKVDIQIIKLLLQHGADINAADYKGRTALNQSYNYSEELKQLFSSFKTQNQKYK